METHPELTLTGLNAQPRHRNACGRLAILDVPSDTRGRDARRQDGAPLMATRARAEDSWCSRQGRLNVAQSCLSIVQTSVRSVPLGSGRSGGHVAEETGPRPDPECGVGGVSVGQIAILRAISSNGASGTLARRLPARRAGDMRIRP